MFDVASLVLAFLPTFSIYLILTTSMNLEFGYAGIPNLGKVLFFAGGASTVGSLMVRLGAIIFGLDFEIVQNIIISSMVARKLATANLLIPIILFILMLLLGAIVAASLGFLLSFPVTRLKGFHLGILLLLSGEIFRLIGTYYDPFIGGTFGIAVPSPFVIINDIFIRDIVRVITYLSIAFAIWFIIHKMLSSPLGRTLRGIRDSEVATSTFGKDVNQIKLKTLILGSALAGVAGALYAFYIGYISAEDFGTGRSLIVLLMVLLGGKANSVGSLLGALCFSLLDTIIQYIKYYIPWVNINYVALGLFAIGILLLLLVKPEGLMHEKPTETINFDEIRNKSKR